MTQQLGQNLQTRTGRPVTQNTKGGGRAKGLCDIPFVGLTDATVYRLAKSVVVSSYLQSVSLTRLRVEYIWHIVTLGIASSSIIVRIPNLCNNRVTRINLRFSVSASAFSNFGSTPALSTLFSQCTCEAMHTPPASFCTSENAPSSET